MKIKNISLLLAFTLLASSNLKVVNASSNGQSCPSFTYSDTLDVYNHYQTYYSSSENVSGQELLTNLASGLENSHRYYNTYSEIKGIMAYADEDPANPSNWIMFYANESIPNTWDGNLINREHVWCKSHSSGIYNEMVEGTRNAGSDPYNLRPAYASINKKRSNIPYGELPHEAQYELHYNNKFTYNYIDTSSSGDTFEPYDGIKGDVARILLYMHTHYSIDYLNSSTKVTRSKMALEDITKGVDKTSSLELLKRWSELDPVDERELKRNEVIGQMCGVRNPFVDFPNLINSAFFGSEASNYFEPLALLTNETSLTYEVGSVNKLNFNKSNYLTYEVSNPEVLSINDDGTLTALKEGVSDITIRCGVESLNLSITVEPIKVTIPSETKTYEFSNYPSGAQYAKDEEHVLDESINFSLFTTDCHFNPTSNNTPTGELRVYNSTTYPGYFYSSELLSPIKTLTLNGMYNDKAKPTSFYIYGKVQGGDFELIKNISLTNEFADYEISFNSNNYVAFKVEPVRGASQIRFKYLKLALKEEASTITKLDTFSNSNVEASLAFDFNARVSSNIINDSITLDDENSNNFTKTGITSYSNGNLKLDNSKDYITYTLPSNPNSSLNLSFNIKLNTLSDTNFSYLEVYTLKKSERTFIQKVEVSKTFAEINLTIAKGDYDAICLQMVKNNGNIELSSFNVNAGIEITSFSNISMKFKLNFDFNGLDLTNKNVGVLLIKEADLSELANLSETSLPTNGKIRNLMLDKNSLSSNPIVAINNIPLSSLEETITCLFYIQDESGNYHYSLIKSVSTLDILTYYSSLDSLVSLNATTNVKLSYLANSFINYYKSMKEI